MAPQGRQMSSDLLGLVDVETSGLGALGRVLSPVHYRKGDEQRSAISSPVSVT